MRVACRWPGYHDLVVNLPNGQKPMVIRLNGAPGAPTTMPMNLRNRPSREAAHQLSKQVVDTVKKLKSNSGDDFESHEYGVTEVQNASWHLWYEQNKDFDVIKHRFVFSL